jgi:tetratricopeptide (TPR) repeat protein
VRGWVFPPHPICIPISKFVTNPNAMGTGNMNVRKSSPVLGSCLAVLCTLCAATWLPAQTNEAPAAAEDGGVATAAAETPESTPAEQADDLFEQGRKALFKGQYEQAIELLQKAVALDTDGRNTSYRLNLARAYRYAGQGDKSENLLKEIVAASPDHVEAGQLLAEIYYTQERWQDIVNVLKPLLKFRHDYPIYHMLAEAEYNLDDYDAARGYYREAIRLNGKSAVDHYQLANIYLANNRFALAVSSYETAVDLGIASPVLHYKLASAYFNLRNYFGAVSVATVAAGEPGTLSDGYYLIERVPGSQDTFRVSPPKSAVYQVAKAMAGDLSQRVDLQMLRANTYLNARRYEQAHEFYAALSEDIQKEAKEDRALYHFYYAESSYGLGQYDEYLEHLAKAIELDPESYSTALLDAYLKVADRYNQAGEIDKYTEYLAKAVDENPQNASLHLKLGHGYEEADEYEKAVQQFRMTLDLEPEHPERTTLLNLIKELSSKIPAPQPE